MGRIVRRDGSTTEVNSTETKNIQTEAASDPSAPVASESSTDSSAQTTEAPSESAQTTAPVITSVTPTTDTTPSSEPTTIEQQPRPNTDRPAETQQPANNNDPPQTGDNTNQDYSAEATSLDNAPFSALPTQASLAVTSSNLPTSVASPISSYSSSSILQPASTTLPCPSSSVSASNSACANMSTDSSQSQVSGGAIAGIVVGAIAALAIVCGCLLFRRRRNSRISEIPPRHRSFLFIEEKPVFKSDPQSGIPSETSVYQSQNTFGVHQNSQVTILKDDYTATTLSSQANEFNNEHSVTTGLYPPIKRDRSNDYIQHANRMSVVVDTDNYTLSAMKLFQPPSRAMSPSSTIRDSQISSYNISNNELQSSRSIYRPSLHQSQMITDSGYLRRESTVDPYNSSKKNNSMSLWDDSLKSEDDSSYSYNPNYEWTHDNGYIQPPIYRP